MKNLIGKEKLFFWKKASPFKFKFDLKINQKFKKILFFSVGILVALFLLFYFKDQFVVALVNYRPISHWSFDQELETQVGKQILESMVTKSLILQEAKKQGVKVEQKDIDDKIKEIELQYSFKGDDLDNFLKLQGQTREGFEKDLKIQIVIEKVLGKEANVSDEEAQKYFEENKSQYPENTTFDQEKENIKNTLKQQKISEKLTGWLEELKGKAKIYYFWKL